VTGLVCPDCRGALAAHPDRLSCARCGDWPDREGFRALLREARVGRIDRFMRLFYDGMPALHDPLTAHLLPRLQGEGSEALLRAGALDAAAFHTLPDDAVPVRILEVGIGTGANLPGLAQRLAGRRVAVDGLDLSRGMLARCRARLPVAGLDVRLVLGDAHRLPYADATFDRVFHVGAAGSWSRPAEALAEMARVAKPGTPIVVVDEQLDRARARKRDRAAFRLLTFYDRDPKAPVAHLPAGAGDVRVRQLSRFYYALSFTMPVSAG
jgi:ubiquinone/menaquinone biosynthesis C-methylase UbiE